VSIEAFVDENAWRRGAVRADGHYVSLPKDKVRKGNVAVVARMTMGGVGSLENERGQGEDSPGRARQLQRCREWWHCCLPVGKRCRERACGVCMSKGVYSSSSIYRIAPLGMRGAGGQCRGVVVVVEGPCLNDDDDGSVCSCYALVAGACFIV